MNDNSVFPGRQETMNNTPRPKQICHHFEDEVYKFVFLYTKIAMGCRRKGDEPLYEPMITLVIDARCRAII